MKSLGLHWQKSLVYITGWSTPTAQSSAVHICCFTVSVRAPLFSLFLLYEMTIDHCTVICCKNKFRFHQYHYNESVICCWRWCGDTAGMERRDYATVQLSSERSCCLSQAWRWPAAPAPAGIAVSNKLYFLPSSGIAFTFVVITDMQSFSFGSEIQFWSQLTCSKISSVMCE